MEKPRWTQASPPARPPACEETFRNTCKRREGEREKEMANLSSLVHELRERIAASSSTPPNHDGGGGDGDDALEARFRAVLPNLLQAYVVPSSSGLSLSPPFSPSCSLKSEEIRVLIHTKFNLEFRSNVWAKFERC